MAILNSCVRARANLRFLNAEIMCFLQAFSNYFRALQTCMTFFLLANVMWEFGRWFCRNLGGDFVGIWTVIL